MSSIFITVLMYASESFYLADLGFVSKSDQLKATDWASFNQKRWEEEPFAFPRLEMNNGENGFLVFPKQSGKLPKLAIRSLDSRPSSGTIILPQAHGVNPLVVKFQMKVITADQKRSKVAFYTAKEQHYARLHGLGIPGGAWFRHQAQSARVKLGELGVTIPQSESSRRENLLDISSSLKDSYELFSGGRALSENLALDRLLRINTKIDDAVAINTIQGITVKEFDWKGLIAGKTPQKDPLAKCIPADQPVIFFSSHKMLRELMTEYEGQGLPVLDLLSTRAEDSRPLEFYQKQLCLPLKTMGNALGPAVVASFALTASDPNFRTGTDIAVLFEVRDMKVLRAEMQGLRSKILKKQTDVRGVTGLIDGKIYQGVENADRSICSYQIVMGNFMAVSNSLEQLRGLVRSFNGEKSSLADLDEYIFFRDRYKRDDIEEKGLAILSDAAIRRWCGPRWRIGDSRRIRAAAALSELQATVLERNGRPLDINKLAISKNLDWLGHLTINRGNVVSEQYGSLNFLAPISEMKLDYVSSAESLAYRQFRDNYQRNWRRYFDPIAVRFAISKNRLAVDVTVMPLIDGTDYRGYIEWAGNAHLTAGGGDPHPESILQFLLALDTKSQWMTFLEPIFVSLTESEITKPFDWLGNGISLYADDSDFWETLLEIMQAADLDTEKTDELLEKKLKELHPDKNRREALMEELTLAINMEVKDSKKLKDFITSLKSYILKETSPDAIRWLTKEHKGKIYECVFVKIEEEAEEDWELPIYYYASSDLLTFTLSRKMMHNVIERSLENRGNKTELVKGEKFLNDSSVAFRFRQNALVLLENGSRETLFEESRRKSWGNIPILNEWKRLQVDSPVSHHEKWWHVRLICPGGGEYRWNNEFKTMESTKFGHPAKPTDLLPTAAHLIHNIHEVRFGITFENNGLRAKGEILRK